MRLCVCVCVCVSGALADNLIGAEGASALAEAFRHNSSLQEMYLNGEPHPALPNPMMRHYFSLGSPGPLHVATRLVLSGLASTPAHGCMAWQIDSAV